MNAMANESDFVVSSLEDAILRTSIGLELRLETWKTWPLSLTMTSSLPDRENAAHCIRLPSLLCLLEMSVLTSLLCPSWGWIKIGVPDCVQVVMQTRFSSPLTPGRNIADETPLSSDS